MEFKPTNEKLTPKQLNDLIAYSEKIVLDFPCLDGRTVSYDYEADANVVSLMWEHSYKTSEDHGDYVLDFNSEGKIIGIEFLRLPMPQI
jgi:uncharacterized protein YuzE